MINSAVNFTNLGTVRVAGGMLELRRGFLAGVFDGPGKTLLTETHDVAGDLRARNLEILASVTLNGARLHGTIRFEQGQLITPPGAAGTTIAEDCTFSLAPSGGKFLIGAITNRGVMQMLGDATLAIQDFNANGFLVNHELIDSQSDTRFSGYPGASLVNHGEWRQSADTAIAKLSGGMAIENRGVISAFAGSFDPRLRQVYRASLGRWHDSIRADRTAFFELLCAAHAPPPPPDGRTCFRR
jgi:hypothetical protein